MPVLLLAALLCALAYLGLTTRPAGWLRSTVKTAAVALLALFALQAGAPALLVLALGLCAAGDYALSRPGERAFLAGALAFGAGHLSYIALFLSAPASDPARLSDPIRLGALIGLIGLGALMLRLVVPRAGRLKGAALAYTPVILTMSAAALTLPGAVPLAALAFLISDMILAADVFLMRPGQSRRRWAPYAIWPLYWGAQAGFLDAFLSG